MSELDSEPDFSDHPTSCDLTSYAAFYEFLSDSAFRFVSLGVKRALGVHSHVYLSMRATLLSIQSTVSRGRLGDAYALLRRYYDSVIIDTYTNAYLPDNHSLENWVVEKIDSWVRGDSALPRLPEMYAYIRSSEKTAPMSRLLNSDDRYKQIRDRCNDHLHYNFYRYVQLNDGRVHLPERPERMDELRRDVRDVFVMHLAFAFFLNDAYMMASNYVDALDCGVTPAEGSQYWVAAFVQEIFDSVLRVHRPDVVELIKGHTSMQLE
jgi:hypothetical protein